MNAPLPDRTIVLTSILSDLITLYDDGQLDHLQVDAFINMAGNVLNSKPPGSYDEALLSLERDRAFDHWSELQDARKKLRATGHPPEDIRDNATLETELQNTSLDSEVVAVLAANDITTIDHLVSLSETVIATLFLDHDTLEETGLALVCALLFEHDLHIHMNFLEV